jgi:hypothetical protein
MKRLAMATVVLTALAGMAQAGGLPKPIRMGDRMKMFEITHSVAGKEPRGSNGYRSETTEEARREVEKDAKTAARPDPKPQPAKAD